MATPIDDDELNDLVPPSQKSIHEKGSNSRSRTNITKEQANILQSVFDVNPFPDAVMRHQLEEVTELPRRVIQVWFQNRRSKKKMKKKGPEELDDL